MAQFAAVAVMSLSLFGCAGTTGGSGQVSTEANKPQVDPGEEGTSAVDFAFNGSEVTCGIYNGYESGGLVCDWAGKRPARPETSTNPLDGELFHRVLKTSQGDVDCIVYDGYKSGSMSCDLPIKK